jgi:hypothetical protein
MAFKACSGAATNDIFNANETNPTEPAQLSSLSSGTKIVTLTIGGNDAGFPWVLEHCVEAPIIRPNFGCAANKQLVNETQARIGALAGGSYATSPPPLYQPIHSLLSVLSAGGLGCRYPVNEVAELARPGEQTPPDSETLMQLRCTTVATSALGAWGSRQRGSVE